MTHVLVEAGKSTRSVAESNQIKFNDFKGLTL